MVVYVLYGITRPHEEEMKCDNEKKRWTYFYSISISSRVNRFSPVKIEI